MKDLSEKEQTLSTIERFMQYPMYFTNFYGGTDVNLLIETLKYAIYAYDVRAIYLDNLQFMLSNKAKGYDKFDL